MDFKWRPHMPLWGEIRIACRCADGIDIAKRQHIYISISYQHAVESTTYTDIWVTCEWTPMRASLKWTSVWTVLNWWVPDVQWFVEALQRSKSMNHGGCIYLSKDYITSIRFSVWRNNVSVVGILLLRRGKWVPVQQNFRCVLFWPTVAIPWPSMCASGLAHHKSHLLFLRTHTTSIKHCIFNVYTTHISTHATDR